MSGCDTKHDGAGDYDAGENRVLGWVAGGAGLIGLSGALSVAEIGVVGGIEGLIAAAAILAAAGAGAILGFFIGFAVLWFDRLHVQSPEEITMAGCVLCAGKNTGFPPFNDNDWTFNLGGSSLAVQGPAGFGLTVQEIRTRGAPGGGPAFTIIDPASGQAAFHCEIGSRIGDYAAVGAAAGAVAGAVAGALIGAAICTAIGLLTFGIGALLCLLVVAIAIAVGAFVGGAVGNTIGAGIGAIADAASDFDEIGESVSSGCIMALTGRWVTDSAHQHNEIHDVTSAQLIECNDCVEATGTSSSGLIAAVGIGRHPTGRDP